MKTLKDLKKFLSAIGGKLKIGEFEISLNDQDVDIKIENRFIAWVPNSVSHDEELEKVVLSIDLRIKDLEEKDKIKEKEIEKKSLEAKYLEDKIKYLEDKIKFLKDESEKEKIAIGKVEVYEKILIGRDLTIGMKNNKHKYYFVSFFSEKNKTGNVWCKSINFLDTKLLEKDFKKEYGEKFVITSFQEVSKEFFDFNFVK